MSLYYPIFKEIFSIYRPFWGLDFMRKAVNDKKTMQWRFSVCSIGRYRADGDENNTESDFRSLTLQ